MTFHSLAYMTFFLILTACRSTAQHTDSIEQIEFESISRGGGREHIVITRQNMRIEREKPDQKKIIYTGKTAPGEWKDMVLSLKDMPLQEMSTLKSPTMKRAYDGARHSTLTIITNDSTIVRHGFDDDQPHEKLLPLMNSIREMQEKLYVRQKGTRHPSSE